MDFKVFFVKPEHMTRRGIRHEDMNATTFEPQGKVTQAAMVFEAKAARGVGCKRGGRGYGLVGWIEVDEVTAPCPAFDGFEGIVENLSVLQPLRAREQVRLIADQGSNVTSERDIESAVAVFAIKTIEAGSVQVDHPNRHFDIRVCIDGSLPLMIEIVLVIGSLLQASDHLPRLVSKSPISANQP